MRHQAIIIKLLSGQAEHNSSRPKQHPAEQATPLFCGKKHIRPPVYQTRTVPLTRRRRVVFRSKRRHTQYSAASRTKVVVFALEKKHSWSVDDSSSCGASQKEQQEQHLRKKQRCTGRYSATPTPNVETKRLDTTASAASRPTVSLGQKRSRCEQSTSFERRRRRLQPSVALYKRPRGGASSVANRGCFVHLLGKKHSTPPPQEGKISVKRRLV